MPIQDLQAYLNSNFVQGGAVPVDLFKIARQVILKQRSRIGKGQQQQQHNAAILRLVLDGECCLDRLYGGYFSDWACGGQWNRMVQFLAVLIQATEVSGVELAVFFNGCQEAPRRADWIQNQLRMRTKVNNVLKHITTKRTPPPKVWWTPPVCLRTSLRMALRHLKVPVLCSMDDHHQEVIAFCRENNYNGLIADDAEYAAFDPPRYFSSEQLKLTYKGSLDTKEYMISELTKALGIPSDRLCILSALLGNYILTAEHDLVDFYKKLNLSSGPNRTNHEQTIRTLANFVKELPSTELDAVAQKVFGSLSDPRCSKLRQSVQYYINGTKEGFLHYKPVKPTKPGNKSEAKQTVQVPSTSNPPETAAATPEEDTNLEPSRFASETVESEQESLNAYKQATANAKAAPEIVIEPPGVQGQSDAENAKLEEEQTNGHAVNGVHNLLISSSSSSSSSTVASPAHVTPEPAKPVEKPTTIPSTVSEVMRTASERHQKGLMSPHIYQILTAGEIKLPVLLEDENHREFPSIHLIYRPVRQMVYAILFNLHHRMYLATKSKEKGDNDKVEVPDVLIKEWIWSKTNPFQTPTLVKAEQIGWGVPTIQRLWFGTGIDDKRRRLRGFLTCMRSDTPLMLNISYVPQHLLVMACVLRYIMTFSDKVKILRRQELDAFIAQSFSADLMNTQHLQDLQLSLVSSRGVQLATLFMAGVETALFANDACGAPIPWLMCCPWLYFDGKLFHHTLARATVAKNLLELCGGHIEGVVKVERMRKAILEGVNVVFARPPLPVPPGNYLHGGHWSKISAETSGIEKPQVTQKKSGNVECQGNPGASGNSETSQGTLGYSQTSLGTSWNSETSQGNQTTSENSQTSQGTLKYSQIVPGMSWNFKTSQGNQTMSGNSQTSQGTPWNSETSQGNQTTSENSQTSQGTLKYSQIVPGMSWNFKTSQGNQKTSGNSQTSRGTLKYSQIVPGMSWNFKTSQGNQTIPGNSQTSQGTSWNSQTSQGYQRTSGNSQTSQGTSWNSQTSQGTSWNSQTSQENQGTSENSETSQSNQGKFYVDYYDYYYSRLQDLIPLYEVDASLSSFSNG